MGNVPTFEWIPDTEPNVSEPEDGPKVQVWLYSNQEEFDKFYDYFLTAEDLVNSVAGEVSADAFENFREMFDSYDGYALNMEVDFEQA